MPCFRQLIFACLLFTCLLAQGQASEEYSQILGEIGTNTTESAGRIIRLSDGNFMTCGQWYDGLPFLLKMDPAGRTIFRMPYYLAGNDGNLYDLVELPNGNIAATGGCQNCMPGDTGFALLSILTDPSGTLIQLRKHGSPGVVDHGYGIDTLANGGIVVAGQRPPFGLLYFYDHSLNLQDSAIFRMTGGAQEIARDVVTASDGSLFVTGRTTVSWQPYVLLRKFSAAGAEIWAKRFYLDNLSASAYGNQVLESRTGSILVCGARYNNSAYSADMFITEFTADTGAVVTERMFGTGAVDMAYAMDRNDDQVLVSGMIRQQVGTGNLWRTAIYRLDSGLNTLDSVVYDRPIMRDQPSGVSFVSDRGQDFVYTGISYSSNYQQQDIFWGRHFQRGEKVHLTEFPRSLQLYPRDLSSNEGQVRVRGYVTDSTQPWQIARLRVWRGGMPFDSLDQGLTYANDTAFIAIDHALPAELADYDYELSLVNGSDKSTEASAVNVVAGDAFLVTGQSNAVSRQRDSIPAEGSPWIRTYGSGNAAGFPDRWFVGDPNADMTADGNIGQLSATLGRELVGKQLIPVAIINGGHNGANIDFFPPNPLVPTMSTNYGRTLTRAQNSGLREKIRAVIFWHGETDAFYGTLPAFYTMRLDSTRRSWLRDYPAIEQIYMFQIRPGCSAGPNGIARTIGGQFVYADTTDGLHLLSSSGLQHLSDLCHYNYLEGYLPAGKQLYERMRPHLYPGPVLPNTSPPFPDSAWFPNCAKDTIRLALRNTTDTYTVDAAIGPDFILSDTSVHVTSASMSGHVLTLVLDDTLGGNASLAYYGHIGPVAPALLNANGIGLLGFVPIPVVCRPENPPFVGRPIKGRILISVRAQILRTGDPGVIDIADTGKKPRALQLTDLYGKVLWQGNGTDAPSGRITLPNLAHGVYLLRIEYFDGSEEIIKILQED